MHLGADDFKDAMHANVWRAVQHYRETRVVDWTPPPGTPTTDDQPACQACGDIGQLAIREPGEMPRYVNCTACDLAVRRMLAQIHPDFRNATFERFRQAARTPKAVSVGVAMERWAASGSGSCLLMGDFGALKTTLATAAWRQRVEQHTVGSAAWVIVPDLLEDIRHSYDREAGTLSSLAFERAQTADLLLFDDLGAEKVTERNRDWIQEQLYRLINWRSNHQLATIFTTNLSTKQLEVKLGRAIVSRIEGMCGARIWMLDQGTDFRRVAR